ncbi:MAG: hypothetical protein JSS99_07775 [Actinobacteria bacterium]|nr:hypothetical protein [Actinomycetota bacterium]
MSTDLLFTIVATLLVRGVRAWDALSPTTRRELAAATRAVVVATAWAALLVLARSRYEP